MPWIAYEDHHRYWLGLNGGKDPSSAYRKFVRAGLAVAADRKVDRLRDWVYGGEDFLRRMLAMAAGEDNATNERRIRRIHPLTAEQILKVVAQHYGVMPEDYCGFRSTAGGRDLAAYLYRRYSSATLKELSALFGLGHPGGSRNHPSCRRSAERQKD